MKTLFNTVLRWVVKAALHLYFHKIRVEGKENIPSHSSVIIVANHQNALLDPLLIATHVPLSPHFMTRAAAFKNPIAAKLLNFIRMLPVYRIRDGFSTIPQNQGTFEQTFKVLRKKGSVLIFAEGNHSFVRGLRPLSKGFTRMAYGTMERYPEVKPIILPVGLDFSAHKKSGSTVRITIGKPIPVDVPSSESVKLTKRVEEALRSLIVSIPEEGYDQTLEKLHHAQVDLTSKYEVDHFLSGIDLAIKKTGSRPYLVNKMMKIFHFPLYWVWLGILAPQIEDEVFTSTWKFLVGFVLAIPFYMMLIWLSSFPILGPWAWSWLILSLITVLWNKNPQE